MIRRTLLALALLAAPAVVMAQQPSPMQGQAPAADTRRRRLTRRPWRSTGRSTPPSLGRSRKARTPARPSR